MFSRAHVLINNELRQLKKEPLWGIQAGPIEDNNVFEWVARIRGPSGTIWEDGVFQVYIMFGGNYGIEPPKLCFHTIPFHPNIDAVTGRPCIDFLDDWSAWNESYSISMILLSIQNLLANPVHENAANMEAMVMMLKTPAAYKQVVLSCVKASIQIEAGDTPFVRELVSISHHPTAPKTPRGRNQSKKVAKLSFEDYLTTWNGMATSKPQTGDKNPYLELIKGNGRRQEIHLGATAEQHEQLTKHKLESYDDIIYGRLDDKQKKTSDKVGKVEKLNQMRKIYLSKNKGIPSGSSARTPRTPQTPHTHGNNDLDRDMDDLVEWTKSLDPADID